MEELELLLSYNERIPDDIIKTALYRSYKRGYRQGFDGAIHELNIIQSDSIEELTLRSYKIEK